MVFISFGDCGLGEIGIDFCPFAVFCVRKTGIALAPSSEGCSCKTGMAFGFV